MCVCSYEIWIQCFYVSSDFSVRPQSQLLLNASEEELEGECLGVGLCVSLPDKSVDFNSPANYRARQPQHWLGQRDQVPHSVE